MAEGHSNVVSDLKDLITCAECNGTFEDPRALSCRHNFCLRCLIKMFNLLGTSDNILICPTCQTGTLVIDGIVDNLPRYFQAEKIETILDNHRSLELSAADLKHTLCSFDDNNKAVSYCFTCTMKMCTPCKTIHDAKPGFDKHLEITASEGLLRALTCNQHAQQGKMLEAYCTECWMPVCRICHITDHNDSSHVNCVHEFCECNGETHRIGMSLQKKKNALKTTIRDVDMYLNSFDEHVNAVHDEISLRKMHLMQQLEKCEQLAHDKLEKHRQEAKLTLQDTKQRASSLLSEIKKANMDFLNITQPLPQAPALTIVNAEVYLDEIKSIADKADVDAVEPPRYRFKFNSSVNAGDFWGSVEEDKTRPKTKGKPCKKLRNSSSRGSFESSSEYKPSGPSTDAANPKQTRGLFNYLFGSRSSLTPQLHLNTPGVVEAICCKSNGDIITFLQDPCDVRVYASNGQKLTVAPELTAISNTRRAALYDLTSTMAVINPSKSTKNKTTLSLYSLGANMIVNEFEVDGHATAVCFNRYEDILVCSTSAAGESILSQFNRNGECLWHCKIQHGCQRMVVNREEKIIMLSNYIIHIHDSAGKEEMSFVPKAHENVVNQAPRGLCVDAQNNILVADQRNQTVSAYTPTGRFIKDIVKIDGTPRDVTLCNDRSLLIGTFDKQLFMYSYC